MAAIRLGTSTHQLVTRLNQEWDQLVETDPPVVRDWAARHAGLAGCHSLAELLPCVRRDPDAALRSLLHECAAGDSLAGRAVVQAMLGKLILMSRRTPLACVDDFVAALWICVATYPLDSRPHRVAANLALDTLKIVTTENRAAQGLELKLGLESPTAHERDAVSARQVIAAGRRLGIINARTSEAMVSVYAEQLSGREAAQRLATTPEMVRYRCSDGVRRLAAHRRTLWDAA